MSHSIQFNPLTLLSERETGVSKQPFEKSANNKTKTMRAHQRTKRRPGSDVKMKIVRENEARISKMLGSGMSVSAMCRRIGISRYTWYRYKAGQNG